MTIPPGSGPQADGGCGRAVPGDLRGCGGQAYVAAVAGEGYPVQWTGRQAAVSVPEHLDVSNVGQLSEQLLVLTNRGRRRADRGYDRDGVV